MNKIGILHLSDLHIENSSINEINKMVIKLIDDINKIKIENNIEIDLVLFAGDLINRGDMALDSEKQLSLAEKYFINPLLDALNLYAEHFIIVPGNHEVDINKIAEMTENGLAAISSLEKINDIVEKMADEYKSRVMYFYEYMKENFIRDANIWNLGYSINREIKGASVGIVGLDSAWRSSGKGSSERGNLIVSESQVSKLYDDIKDAELKICLMHHPLDWLTDFEMTAVERKLNRFDLVLRGHVHDLDDKQISTQKYRTIYNTSGKLHPNDSNYSGYSIIDIDFSVNKCKIYSREYFQSPREEFDKALRINENGEVEYKLSKYDEQKEAEIDLLYNLQGYYEAATEKYAMLKSIDVFSPKKATDFYVEPVISEKQVKRTDSAREYDINDNESNISLDDIFASKDNFLIMGKKECGKTTVLQRFGYLYSNSDLNIIPIYLDMRKMPSTEDRILIACRNFIANNVSDNISMSKEQVKQLLNDGRVVCLFDNVNISSNHHMRWIQNFIKAYPDNRYIFAAEEKFYQEHNLKEYPTFDVDYRIVHLNYFKKNQVRQMVTKWGDGKDGFDANHLTDRIVTYCKNINFAMTPFNVAVFLTIWDVDRNFTPLNEGKVMRTYLEILLDKLSTEELQISAYDYDIKEHFLGYLSYQMYKKDEFFFTKDEFNKVVNEYHHHMGYQIVESKFDKIFFEKNILCENGNSIYFSNTSIMEYCLATHARVDNNIYEMMTKPGNRVSFAREISFYSGIVPDCTKLLEDLNDEVTQVIIDNMDILDEIEDLKIGIELNLDKESVSKNLSDKRRTIEEADHLKDMNNDNGQASPMELSKKDSLDKGENFLDILLIYGSVIKNAETLNKSQKKIHIENYMLGMNILFGMIVSSFSEYLVCQSKDNLPEEIKAEFPEMTNEQFDCLKRDVLDLVKMSIPIGIQIMINENIGSPKLDVVISELLDDNQDKKFTRFMLSFLLCDIGRIDIKSFLMKYIKEEKSVDILKLVLFKVSYYYTSWHFGKSATIDSALLDVITELQIILNGGKTLGVQISKGKVKQEIKEKHDQIRAKKVS